MTKIPDGERSASPGDIGCAVTFGQLSVIRSLGAYEPDGLQNANLISVWQVPEGASVAHVAEAWNTLVAAHESLRTSYDLNGDRPQQVVHPPRLRPLRTIEVDDFSPGGASAAAAPLAADPIALDSEVPWRAVVATCDLEPLYLVVVVHHIAADNGGLQLLEQQFRDLVGGAALPTQPQPREMAIAQQSEPRLGPVEHWERRWTSFDVADRRRDDTTPRRRASVYSRAALLAARATAERTRSSVQSVVLAVSALQLGRALRRSSLTLGLMAANRFDDDWAGVVTSLNQCVPLTVEPDPSMSPEDFVRRVHLASLGAYLNGCFDVDELTARVGDPDPTFFSTHYNYLGEMLEDPASSSPLGRGETVWRSSAQRHGPNGHVAVAAGAGLLIGVGASEAFLPGEAPATLANSIRAALKQLGDESCRTVGDLGITA